jgi:hypothetical protein
MAGGAPEQDWNGGGRRGGLWKKKSPVSGGPARSGCGPGRAAGRRSEARSGGDAEGGAGRAGGTCAAGITGRGEGGGMGVARGGRALMVLLDAVGEASVEVDASTESGRPAATAAVKGSSWPTVGTGVGWAAGRCWRLLQGPRLCGADGREDVGPLGGHGGRVTEGESVHALRVSSSEE